MSRTSPPSRDRLISAAIELFTRQGLAETTTRQIADLAEVNEVTLFRQFSSKYGLLLALLHDETKLQQWLNSIPVCAQQTEVSIAVRTCARDRIALLLETPALVRSLVGEADSFSPETRAALGTWLAALDRQTEASLRNAIASESLPLPTAQVVRLLDALAIGYAAISLTTAEHLDGSDVDALAGAIATLFASPSPPGTTDVPLLGISTTANDLPAHTVRALLMQAKKLGGQDYA
ncbi:MAG: TetR/AcrR family transcriptional regulator, partial [Cyanobacteria bacterium J06648_11]